jgi:phosphoribosylaminoimidazole-succinocarboxamide synthase
MLTPDQLTAALPLALSDVDLPFLGRKTSGKVREIYRHGDRLILVTTDRLSAFDRILGLVPYKGQVLNQLSAFWFNETKAIVANHLLEVPDPNVAIVRPCEPLPVEIVVRGFITGVTSTALWYRYDQGERHIYGMNFPDGLRKNDPLPEPIITPTTKARDGGHDERITAAEIVERGLVDARRWEEVSAAAIALFRHGQAVAQRAGLILVDTKYEFGIDAHGNLTLIDEVHTPDSSRFWLAESYTGPRTESASLADPKLDEPENFDKEFIRLYYAAQGYRGNGDPFPLPPDLALNAAARYIRAFEMLTGNEFVPGALPAAPRIAQALSAWIESSGIAAGPRSGA